ncbi:hypothetical protein [Solwaraspora sp. WMMA2065]|uniref:hypothetical protein n=1 Tax=Solwaraspora sp. WMMA2065 TaxID=3015166 RepID=UPI00259B3A09|nr:hypothetical protein [Solwaraspora sp. WMMA2065]WJK33175.1 hypothetical protein O7610_21000 [Solwaraspora sp. WMMA2065]
MSSDVTVAPGRLRANRDYVLWWVGNLASGAGKQFPLVAMPLMVLLLTGSPFQARLVGSPRRCRTSS